MRKSFTVGVLALQGDVSEHVRALGAAAEKLKLSVLIKEVRTRDDLSGLAGIIIPGGESTTLQKLCEREGMFDGIRKVPAIFGTCAGTIFLAKEIHGKAENQRTLKLMDIEAERNAYGRQGESFEQDIKTTLGPVHAVFIRAPKILKVGKSVNILATNKGEIFACEQKTTSSYYLATCFHPELSTTRFHERFLRKIMDLRSR